MISESLIISVRLLLFFSGTTWVVGCVNLVSLFCCDTPASVFILSRLSASESAIWGRVASYFLQKIHIIRRDEVTER